MEKFVTSLAIVIALVSAFVWGWCVGDSSNTVAENATVMDTLWVEVHDTCWRVESVKISRIDTVRLAQVVCAENAPTAHDTLIVHDSVYVEIPIESNTFAGDHYRITAHGYAVGLDDVWFDRQVVTNTITHTKYMNKRWRFNVGAQIGYGYTVHGASPYAGIGVAFGYTF